MALEGFRVEQGGFWRLGGWAGTDPSCLNSMSAAPEGLRAQNQENRSHSNTGSKIIRIGFWGTVEFNCNKEPPKWYW